MEQSSEICKPSLADFQHRVKAAGGRVHGRSGHLPAPGHSKNDNGISLTWAPEAPLGVLYHGFNCEPAVASAVVREVFGFSGEQQPRPALAPRRPTAEERDAEAKHRARIERIVAEAQDIHGTPVDDYLQARGLKPPFPRDLRFHPKLWTRDHDGELIHAPGLVALVRRAPGAPVRGIHRTFLTSYGRKNPHVATVKAMLGAIKGGAVWPDEFGTILAIGEGIESCLSFTLLYRVPCVAALSAGNLGNLRHARSVREIIIAADNDANLTGQKAAVEAVRRMRRPWRTVTAICPEGHVDFNDVIMEGK